MSMSNTEKAVKDIRRKTRRKFSTACHMLTWKNPFIDPRILKDRNFLLGTFIFFSVALIMFTVLALTPLMLQNLLGYPVLDAGFFLAAFFTGPVPWPWIVGSSRKVLMPAGASHT
jgi:hypothetical protein